MQLIRPYQIFRLLRDSAVFRRKKLWAHRRIENVVQNPRKHFIGTRVGIVANQMAHKRFGNRSIHRIHGHVVAIVSGPTQGKLGKITCTYDEAICLVGNVHQDLRALARLAVFVRHIMDRRIMIDIGKMLHYRLGNGNLFERGTQAFNHGNSIVVSAVGGAEARHGYRNDALTGQSKHVEGTRRY